MIRLTTQRALPDGAGGWRVRECALIAVTFGRVGLGVFRRTETVLRFSRPVTAWIQLGSRAEHGPRRGP